MQVLSCRRNFVRRWRSPPLACGSGEHSRTQHARRASKGWVLAAAAGAQQQAPTHSTASVPLSFYYSMYLAKQLTSGRPQAQPTVELSTKMRRAEARTASKSAFFAALPCTCSVRHHKSVLKVKIMCSSCKKRSRVQTVRPGLEGWRHGPRRRWLSGCATAVRVGRRRAPGDLLSELAVYVPGQSRSGVGTVYSHVPARYDALRPNGTRKAWYTKAYIRLG